jgi:hypothetical protein
MRKGNGAGLGAPCGEEEDGGPSDAHARAGGGVNGARLMEAGGVGTGEVRPGPTWREGKKQRVGRTWWTADGSAALGRPEVNSSFSDLFK